MFLIRPAGANQSAKVAIGGGGPLLGSAIYGMPAESGEPLPPLSLWHQIDGGQDYGASVTGGSVWFWPNPVVGTFQVWVQNIENTTFDAAQAIVESTSASPSSLTGWGLNVSGWTLDTATYTPGTGTYDSPAATLSDVMELANPLAPTEYAQFQERHSTGDLTAGKTFATNTWPESGQVVFDAFQEGDHLGGAVSGVGIGPLSTRLFLRREASEDTYYNFMVFGDSTTAQVRPLAATNNTAKEGVWHFANAYLRTNNKRVRIYSGGQGGATWAQILSRTRAALPWLAGKVSEIAVQVWTWNSGWLNIEQADAAWAEYLVLEAEIIAAGFGCAPLILNPYTTRNSAGQVDAFELLKAYAVAHPRGIVLDEIMGAASWPDLVPAESEDNIHSNRDGGFRAGPLAAPIFLARAVEHYPELA